MAASDPPYAFELGTIVLFDGDKRAGQVIGRVRNPRGKAIYHVRYVLDGREEIAERDESNLKPAES